jgi:hypothetical protein
MNPNGCNPCNSGVLRANLARPYPTTGSSPAKIHLADPRNFVALRRNGESKRGKAGTILQLALSIKNDAPLQICYPKFPESVAAENMSSS